MNRITQFNESIYLELNKLLSLRINASVLKTTSIVKTLKTILKSSTLHNDNIKNNKKNEKMELNKVNRCKMISDKNIELIIKIIEKWKQHACRRARCRSCRHWKAVWLCLEPAERLVHDRNGTTKKPRKWQHLGNVALELGHAADLEGGGHAADAAVNGLAGEGEDRVDEANLRRRERARAAARGVARVPSSAALG
jgi:hypothetical protein